MNTTHSTKQSTRIERAEPGILPAWCKAGATVAIATGSRETAVRLAAVAAVNTRYVTLDNGDRYSITKGLTEIGERSAFALVPFLADPKSYAVKYAQAIARRDALQYRVSKAHDEFQLRPSRGSAAALQGAIGHWAGQVAKIAVHF